MAYDQLNQFLTFKGKIFRYRIEKDGSEVFSRNVVRPDFLDISTATEEINEPDVHGLPIISKYVNGITLVLNDDEMTSGSKAAIDGADYLEIDAIDGTQVHRLIVSGANDIQSDFDGLGMAITVRKWALYPATPFSTTSSTV